MKAKQSVPVPVIIGALVLVVGAACFFGFKSMSPPGPQAPTAPQMYDKVTEIATKAGGDFNKVSDADKKYLDLMSHGHAQKLFENQYARATASRGK